MENRTWQEELEMMWKEELEHLMKGSRGSRWAETDRTYYGGIKIPEWLGSEQGFLRTVGEYLFEDFDASRELYGTGFHEMKVDSGFRVENKPEITYDGDTVIVSYPIYSELDTTWTIRDKKEALDMITRKSPYTNDACYMAAEEIPWEMFLPWTSDRKCEGYVAELFLKNLRKTAGRKWGKILSFNIQDNRLTVSMDRLERKHIHYRQFEELFKNYENDLKKDHEEYRIRKLAREEAAKAGRRMPEGSAVAQWIRERDKGPAYSIPYAQMGIKRDSVTGQMYTVDKKGHKHIYSMM